MLLNSSSNFPNFEYPHGIIRRKIHLSSILADLRPPTNKCSSVSISLNFCSKSSPIGVIEFYMKFFSFRLPTRPHSLVSLFNQFPDTLILQTRVTIFSHFSPEASIFRKIYKNRHFREVLKLLGFNSMHPIPYSKRCPHH